MRLVVGLGNPGAKYRNNRHNTGFLLLDRYTEKHNLSFHKKLKYDFLKLTEIIFIKPGTFMNRSGSAVTSVLTGNRLEDILVIVDDINLPLGEIRLRNQGGFGGHNGLKSIGSALGTDNFKRLRIGINDPSGKDLADYVLSDFSKHETEILEIVFEFAEILLEEYVEYDFDHMVEKYSKFKKSYSEKIQDSQDHDTNS
ncbi:MAG: aminoacyl-tRNA hydrolase [Candidatus Cloacimonadales bacterium]|nr:aminoacyl-tRNA hydrolase [Candidatus Cloacimonadales bacterium]